MNLNQHNCIIVLGPTASGKTKKAVELALQYNGEIISVDSRQVYQHLNIGTGKDLQEYNGTGTSVPYHLIDLVEPTAFFHVFDYVNAFYKAFQSIQNQGKLPVLAGGTGLYFDVLLKKSKLIAVPVNETLRHQLQLLDHAQLKQHYSSFSNKTDYSFDTSTVKRTIRAIEVLTWLNEHALPNTPFHDLNPYIIGIKTSLEERKQRISLRLQNRLKSGMIEEAEGLLKRGVTHEQLQFFGLEYKYLSLYLQGKLNLAEMTQRLETAIHQYAKRQMTWFRKMEREGFVIHWI